MSKIFYDRLVLREEISVELDRYRFSVEEREELVQIIDETLHHHVLDVIFTHLPKEKHPEFLKKFHAAPHDEKLLEYLRTETTLDIEKEIKSRAKSAKKVLLEQIKRAKKV